MKSEDLQTIEQVRAGNPQAYAVLVRKYQAQVRGYCLGVLAHLADADDAAQEVFIKAYKGLDSFRGEAAFSTWLYRIAANHCRDLLRKRARQRTDSWDRLLEEEGEKVAALLSVAPEAEEPPEPAQIVQRVLACLPEQYRTVLTLREVHSLSYQEIADTLQCSLDTVKSRLRRARREMSEKLSTHFKEAGRLKT